MATVGDIPRPRKRASQDETTPFLLEFEVVPSLNPNLASSLTSKTAGDRGRRSQDETAPFPLMLEALRRRKKRVRQDETSPFLLALAGEPEASPRARRARQGAPSSVLPPLTLHGLNASSELREYAARIASGEDLPPFSGPILAGDEPSSASASAPSSEGGLRGDSPAASERAPRSVRSAPPDTETTSSLRPTSVTSPAKVVLGLTLMLAALVATATAGDDATLRAAGQSVSGWFSGGTPSYEPITPATPAPVAPAPAQTPCVTAAPTQAR